MRGRDQSSGNLFSYVDLEERVPDDHPLRLMRREIVNDVLGSFYLRSSRRFIPTWVAHRSRRRSFFERYCCRRFIRSARSVS